MEFKLTFDMVLKALMFNMIGVAFLIIPLCFTIYLFLHNSNKWTLFGIFFPILVILYIAYNSTGSGYSIHSNILYIQSGSYNKEIDLKEAQVFLTDDEQWKIATRLHGLGTDNLKTGYFQLKNNQKAVVFSYEGGKDSIIIKNQANYYIINIADSGGLIKVLQKYNMN